MFRDQIYVPGTTCVIILRVMKFPNILSQGRGKVKLFSKGSLRNFPIRTIMATKPGGPGPPQQEETGMNETVKNLVERKSCRCYQHRHVDRALLDQIVAAGLNAPSGMNLQTPRFVVVQNEETVKQLSAMNAAVANADSDPFYGAQDLVIVLCKKEGTYLQDGSLAMGNLLNAAWSMGVDSRWIHRAKEVFRTEQGKALLKQWGVQEDVEGIGFCILGYAQEEKEKTPIQQGRVFYVS